MNITLKVHQNGDHTCLVWLPSDGKPLTSCRGFAVRRLRNKQESFLHGFVGFSDDDKLDPAAPWKMPFQRFMWWDYDVKPDDVVQYSVIPVVGPDKDHLQLDTKNATALSEPITVTGQVSKSTSAYFNRGIIAAQWVSRSLATLGKKPKLANVIADIKSPLRQELSGFLRLQILEMLAEARKNNGEIYAALYELNDPELITALCAFGQKCHLLLANGAFKPPGNDENAELRAQLKKEKKIDLRDRLVSGSHFAHNKFVVVCDSAGKPVRVLSGSTNWTMSGLCTQMNNGIIVDSPELAAAFLNEWRLLAAAGNGYPPSLAKTNSTPTTVKVDDSTITQWFVPALKAVDLEFARKLINGAKDGILFLFFNPGGFVAPTKPALQWTLLQNILTRHQAGTPNYNADLYIRGVVNQEIPGITCPPKADATPTHAHLSPDTSSPVSLYHSGKQAPQSLSVDSIVPKSIKESFHNWREESLGSGVHIHSKVIILDPFGDHPVVMTGSHNLGYKASTQNDDNLMIVEGNGALAAAYAVNIIAAYNSYKWNSYVEAHANDPHVLHGLQDSDSWQAGHLSGDALKELRFWIGEVPPAAPVKRRTAGSPSRRSAAAG